MTPKTIILIGRSGCGKGTQAKLLAEHLKKVDAAREVLYVQTGSEFRKFITGTSVSAQLSKNLYDTGGLQPEFLAIYMWVNFLVNNYKGNEHIIMDGMPRKYHEAGVLESIFDFYKLEKPFVVHINVSKDWSIDHLMKRGRIDDTRAEIEERLSWYETEVVPTIEYYRKNPKYAFVEVNGEQTVETVQKEILQKLAL